MASYAFLLLSVAILTRSSLPSSSPATTSSTSSTDPSSASPSPPSAPALINVSVLMNAVTIFALGFLAVTFSLYKKKTRKEKVAKRFLAAIPTAWGSFVAHCYKSHSHGLEHVAMVKGDIGNGKDVLVRVYSECITGDIFRSERCDCGNQLELAMQKVEKAGRGVVVYLRGHEGRGVGLGHKLRAYNLQDDGRDTVQANEDLGLPIDSRDYNVGAQILKDLGVRTINLMTNNPAKCVGLKGYGLDITDRVSVLTPVTKHNKQYLETKGAKMGHVYGSGTNDVPSLLN